MSTTLYRDYQVFKMDLGIATSAMSTSTTTICVASLRCEKNCFPHAYRWSFDFIGSSENFIDRYLPETAFYFDDGLSEAWFLSGGLAFQRYLARLAVTAKPLTVADMHEMNWYGYSLDANDTALIADPSHLKEYMTSFGTRHAGIITTEDHVERMVRDIYQVKANSKRVWLPGLWRVERDMAAILAGAAYGTQFLKIA